MTIATAPSVPVVPVKRVATVVEAMQARRPMLWFEDFDELLDGVAIFGAHFELGRQAVQRTARVVAARSNAKRPALTWLVLMLGLHGIEMNRVSGPATPNRLNYASAFDWRFVAGVMRWSPTGRAAAPTGLELTENTAAMWLASSLDGAAKTVALRLPGNNAALLRRVGRQLQRIAPTGRCGVSTTGGGKPRIELADDALPRVEEWLAERIPPAVWRE